MSVLDVKHTDRDMQQLRVDTDSGKKNFIFLHVCKIKQHLTFSILLLRMEKRGPSFLRMEKRGLALNSPLVAVQPVKYTVFMVYLSILRYIYKDISF